MKNKIKHTAKIRTKRKPARQYDPKIGRFLSVDPMWEYFPNYNPYHYCYNNPVSFKDPTGLAPEGEKEDEIQSKQKEDELQNSSWLSGILAELAASEEWFNNIAAIMPRQSELSLGFEFMQVAYNPLKNNGAGGLSWVSVFVAAVGGGSMTFVGSDWGGLNNKTVSFERGGKNNADNGIISNILLNTVYGSSTEIWSDDLLNTYPGKIYYSKEECVVTASRTTVWEDMANSIHKTLEYVNSILNEAKPDILNFGIDGNAVAGIGYGASIDNNYNLKNSFSYLSTTFSHKIAVGGDVSLGAHAGLSWFTGSDDKIGYRLMNSNTLKGEFPTLFFSVGYMGFNISASVTSIGNDHMISISGGLGTNIYGKVCTGIINTFTLFK